MADGASFLPRIESVFYAVFDEDIGPRIVHQVPEGLIATSTPSIGTANITAANSLFTTSPTSPHPYRTDDDAHIPPSILSSPAFTRLEARAPLPATQKQHTRFLFNFDDVSKYIIPPAPLCGRLVKFATKNHRIIGFPAQLRGRYRRNYFSYNLCFVFDRNADLSCYEPVVRKVSRVLTTCEVCIHFGGWNQIVRIDDYLGRICVFVCSAKLGDYLRNLRAAIRGVEFILRNVYSNRRVQFYRAQDFSLLSEPSPSERLAGTSCPNQSDEED